MTTATKHMTAAELLTMPDDGIHRYELVKGELITMPPAGGEHGAIGINVATNINVFVRRNDLGVVFNSDTGFIIDSDPDTVRAPDLAFMSAERQPQDADEDSYLDVVPDIVGEVRSPNDTRPEVRAKAEMWLSHGVRLCWVVDPDTRTIDVHRPGVAVVTLGEGDTLDGGDVLPGFTCAVATVFGS